jgi:hypothetical protein
MRTCDCGWIADWDLGDKHSCTLYMLGSDVGGEPPGTRWEDDGLSSSCHLRPCSDDITLTEAKPGRAACAVSRYQFHYHLC